MVAIFVHSHKDSNGQECTIVLLDCEGIRNVKGGDADENQIFTLTVLLSSVLIYNSTAVPMRDDCTWSILLEFDN